MKKIIFILITLVACRNGKNSTPLATEPKTFTLTVFVGEGALSNLSPGPHLYKEGESVTYTFSVKEGYENLWIESKNLNLPSSGYVNMDSDKELSATAELKNLPLNQRAQEIKNELGYVLTSPDSASTITSFSALLESLTNTSLADAEAGYKSASQEASSESILKANQFLGGTVWKVDFNTPSPSQISKNTSASPLVTLIIVNGIYNSRDAAALMWLEIKKLVDGSGLAGKIKILGFYNASAWFDNDSRNKCLRLGIEFESYSRLRTCGWLFTGDLIDAEKEIADLTSNIPSESKEVSVLSDLIKKERAVGQRVLLLGHSEGALVVSQALKKIGKTDRCVASISVADPLGQISWSPQSYDGNLRGLVISDERVGDIILVLGKNDFMRLSTNLSRAANERVRLIDNLNLSFSYSAALRMFEDSRLHFFIDSYMSGTESRAEIQSSLMDLTIKLTNQTCSSIGVGEESRIPK